MKKRTTKNDEKPVYPWIVSKFDLVRKIPSILMFQNEQQVFEELSNILFGIACRGNRVVAHRDEEFNTIVEEYESDALLAVCQFSSIKMQCTNGGFVMGTTNNKNQRANDKPVLEIWVMAHFDIVNQLMDSKILKNRQEVDKMVSELVCDISSTGNVAKLFKNDDDSIVVEEYDRLPGEETDRDALLDSYKFSPFNP